jgi:hypothetical protein
MQQRVRRIFLERLELRQLLFGADMLAVAAQPVVEVAESEPGQVPDFSLLDVNPNSPTYNQQVSPRDYLGKVTGWYSGHAT